MSSQPDPGEQRRQRWLIYALGALPETFVNVDDLGTLLVEPMYESSATAGLFLTEAADPHRGGKTVKWQAHAAEAGGIDLLRAGFAARGLEVQCWEGSNFLLMRVGRPEAPYRDAPEKHTWLERSIPVVVKLESALHRWQFAVPADAELLQHPRLANTGAPPVAEIASRHDRVDVLILNGEVHFMFYKKIDQMMGFRPDDGWFSGAARVAIQARLTRR